MIDRMDLALFIPFILSGTAVPPSSAVSLARRSLARRRLRLRGKKLPTPGGDPSHPVHPVDPVYSFPNSGQETMMPETCVRLVHHGGFAGVTGSCHELRVGERRVLVDCGLFQGRELRRKPGGPSHQIEFDIDGVIGLFVTHAHIDHCGRIPYLLAKGFRGPIYCSSPTAALLPTVLEDALRVGVTRDKRLIREALRRIGDQTIPLEYGETVILGDGPSLDQQLSARLFPAGHIMGSAYVQFRIGRGAAAERVTFSGDLGAPYAPLLPAPKPPYRTDTLVLESTYGDRNHSGRQNRRRELKAVLENCLRDRGTILIPAFSFGRTQELLYEVEGIIHRYGREWDAAGLRWQDLEVVVDSPLAMRLTTVFRDLTPYWDKEARRRVRRGRHPLSFDQMTVIDSHKDHLSAVEYLHETGRPCLVVAGSGMCTGGRMVNYLKSLLGDTRTDVVFIGYQARGTPGHAIQRCQDTKSHVRLDGRDYRVKARIHTLAGYSAHADQRGLVSFAARMRHPPKQIRLVHGDEHARESLASALRKELPTTEVLTSGTITSS